LELSEEWSLDELELPMVDLSYWVGPRRFQDFYYNLISQQSIPDELIEIGQGECMILNHHYNGSSSENKLYPSDCGLYKRPFICALYPRQPGLDQPVEILKPEKSVSFKRNQDQATLCKDLVDNWDSCDERTVDQCLETAIGCEQTCCMLDAASDCSQLVDIEDADKCANRKANGQCLEFMDLCAATCCGFEIEEELLLEELESDTKASPNKPIESLVSDEVQDTCGELDDLENARTCFDRAFRNDACDIDYLMDVCAMSCCEAQFVEDDKQVRSSEIAEVDRRSGTYTTTYSPCFELDDNEGDDWCFQKVMENRNRCDLITTFRTKCEHTCCLLDPPPCIFEEDVRGIKWCRKQATNGNCKAPSVWNLCARTCCDAYGGEASPSTETTTESTTTTMTPPTTDSTENTTMITNETTTSETTTTSATTGFQLCGEYFNRLSEQRCEKRVNNSNCRIPFTDETRCQYSCCLSMFQVTTTTEPTTTEQITTEAPADEGLDECSGLADGVSEYICAAVVEANQCDMYESRKSCEFSCCMSDYSHDVDNPTNREPTPVDDCEDEPEDIFDYPTCVEVSTLGRCNDFVGCETTCCLWSNAYLGTPCLAFVDISGYEYCTINCISTCGEDTMCKYYCERTTCLYCDKAYQWPFTTDAPSECYELTNEDSGVACSAVVLNEECDNPVNDGSGVYDDVCNFACCAAYENTFSVKRIADFDKRSLDETNLDNTTVFNNELPLNETPVNNMTSFPVTTGFPMLTTGVPMATGFPKVNESSEAENLTDVQDPEVTSRQIREAEDYDYTDQDLPCINPVTMQNDPDCKYRKEQLELRQKRESNGVEVAESIKQVLDNEFQLQPSVILITFVLIFVKVCLYL